MLDPAIDSAAKAAPVGAGVYAIHAAAGVGYGNGFAGNSHRHAPDGWMPAMKYLVEELHADVNARDSTRLYAAAPRRRARRQRDDPLPRRARRRP